MENADDDGELYTSINKNLIDFQHYSDGTRDEWSSRLFFPRSRKGLYLFFIIVSGIRKCNLFSKL